MMGTCDNFFCCNVAQGDAACENYISFENSEFRIYNIVPGKELIFERMEYNIILFCIKGSMDVFFDDNERNILHSKQMLLLPQSSFLRISPQKKCLLYISFFIDIPGFCHNIYPQLYNKYIINYEFSPTCIHPTLVVFLQSCALFLNQKMICKKISEIKKREFFYFLNMLYTSEQIAYFLHPILNRQVNFRQRVMKYAAIASTATQLANYLGCSRSVFYKKFRDEFQMTVKEWIVKQKIEQIKLLAIKPGISVKEMMLQSGYSSGGNFSRFFQKYFHCTPNEYINRAIEEQ